MSKEEASVDFCSTVNLLKWSIICYAVEKKKLVKESQDRTGLHTNIEQEHVDTSLNLKPLSAKTRQ